MARLVRFINGAQRSLDLALYDLRLSPPLLSQLRQALTERAQAGVQVRICFDGDKPLRPDVTAGQDPAPPGTSAMVQSLGFPWRRIAGMKLMHHKFIVRDRTAVWTGSLNITDDAFTLMENNVVTIDSPETADFYALDFDEIWRRENFEGTGEIKTREVQLTYRGRAGKSAVMFSPGCGLEIDAEIARRIKSAAAACSHLAACSLTPARSLTRCSAYSMPAACKSMEYTIERNRKTFTGIGRMCRRTAGRCRRSRTSWRARSSSGKSRLLTRRQAATISCTTKCSSSMTR